MHRDWYPEVSFFVTEFCMHFFSVSQGNLTTFLADEHLDWISSLRLRLFKESAVSANHVSAIRTTKPYDRRLWTKSNKPCVQDWEDRAESRIRKYLDANLSGDSAQRVILVREQWFCLCWNGLHKNVCTISKSYKNSLYTRQSSYRNGLCKYIRK